MAQAPAGGRVAASAAFAPILQWLPRYRRTELRGDLIGAATAWAIATHCSHSPQQNSRPAPTAPAGFT